MTSGGTLHALKSGYAAAAHGLGGLLDRAGLLPQTPPPRVHTFRHWAYSLTRVHDSVGLVTLDVPWWSYRAIDAVDAWLRARRTPPRVFEYGSGASTVWLSRRADEVYTVEHDARFAAVVAGLLEGTANTTLHLVEPVPASAPTVPSAKEGYAGLDFAEYVAAIDAVPGRFDLVVVDGRARAACLARALPRMNRDGLVVFDNSRRRRYRASIESAEVLETKYFGLTPTLPYPDQTSLLRYAATRV